MKKILTAIILVSLIGGACRTYESASIRVRKWPTGQEQSLRDVGMGYFSHRGVGTIPYTRQNFYESMSFSLRESGYTTHEYPRIQNLLADNALATNRLLSPEEIMRLRSKFPGKLFLQGDIQENRTETLTEEFIQVMINVSIHDMTTGKKIGTIKLFGKDMKHNTGREVLAMSRIITGEIEKLIKNRIQL